MADLAVQVVTPQTLLTPTYAAASGGGDAFAPAGIKCIVHVKNAHSASWTLTFNDPTSLSPEGAIAFNPDVSFVIPNAAERMFSLEPGRFTNPANGKIEWTYSGVTALTIAVFRLA